ADYQNQISESNEANNVWNTIKVTVTPPPQPDLFGLLNTRQASMPSAGNLTIYEYTSNIGAATAPASTTGIYLSAYTTIPYSDFFHISRDSPSLAVSLASRYYDFDKLILPLPRTTLFPYTTLFRSADYQNQISESNEANNVWNTIKVTVTPPPQPDL